jgi:excisionase family DNA binding protein
MADKLLNVEQVRDMLGCSRSHVYRLKDMGELRGLFVGNRKGLRIYFSSVTAFLRRREAAANASG